MPSTTIGAQHPVAPPPPLLAGGDPEPVEIVNPGGRSDVLLVCEHAGRAIPSRLGRLGLDPVELERHIAWDIGAEGLARALSQALDAPLALQRYSRLVVDCNRPPTAPDFIPEQSDGTLVPGNLGLDPARRAQRQAEIHAPFHDAVALLLSHRLARGPVALVAVHSFTPMLRSQAAPRPWHAGFLFNRDPRLSEALLRSLPAIAPDAVAALNEPYSVDDEGDHTIPVHGEARGIPHTLLEVRNDLIAEPEGQALWAARLSRALSLALSTLSE